MTQTMNTNAGLLRRLGAMLYDTLLVIALLIVVTFAFVPLLRGRVLVPQEVGALAYVYWIVQLAAVAAFFMYFWTRRGQTVGMLAWRLRIQNLDGSNMRWQTASKRLVVHAILLVPFFLSYSLVWRDWTTDLSRKLAFGVSIAPAVLPYLWIVFDTERRSWHDRWTDTRVVVLPKVR